MLHPGWEAVGWIGFVLAIGMFLPQVIKVIRTRDISTLSHFSFGVNAFGCSMWVVISASLEIWQSFAGNGINLILMCFIFYYMYEKRKQHFWAWIAFTVVTFAVSIPLGFVLTGVHIAVEYVFGILANVSLGVAFAPQVRAIFVLKNFRSFSVISNVIIILCTLV